MHDDWIQIRSCTPRVQHAVEDVGAGADVEDRGGGGGCEDKGQEDHCWDMFTKVHRARVPLPRSRLVELRTERPLRGAPNTS